MPDTYDAIRERLQKAIDNGETITIKYRKYSGEFSERAISDIHWTDEYGGINDYVEAFCHLRMEKRTFKVSRILSINGEVFHVVHDMNMTKSIFAPIPVSATPSPSSIKMASPTIKHAPIPVEIPQDDNTPLQPESSDTRTTNSPTSSKKEGCYIATMAYGDYNHPQVIELRKFRDCYLKSTKMGAELVLIYYAISPHIVSILKGHNKINSFIRKMLDAFVRLLKRKNII